jgi:16S rRNA (guanine527-N7)-methyltransferase
MIEKGLQYLSPQGEWNSLLKTGATAIKVSLSDEQVELFFLYWRELQEWNRYTNITAISSPRDTIIKHFLDSLSVIGSIPCSGRLADIGSGGGFPGIPIAIVKPDLKVVLIEAARKKANFLRQVVRVLGLKTAEVYHGRAETLSVRERFECLVSRAFSSIETLLKISAPLLADDGIIIVMKGKDIEQELKGAEQEIKKAQLIIAEERHFVLPFRGGTRTIIVFRRNVSRETLA